MVRVPSGYSGLFSFDFLACKQPRAIPYRSATSFFTWAKHRAMWKKVCVVRIAEISEAAMWERGDIVACD